VRKYQAQKKNKTFRKDRVFKSLIFCFFLFMFFISSGFCKNEIFNIGRLKYSGGGDWYSNPSSLPNLQRELGKITSMSIGKHDITVSLKDNSVHSTPVIYMTGHGNVRFSKEEANNLRAYLKSGGFLWADDNYGMDESFRKQMKVVFPAKDLTKIPVTHKIFKSPYPMAKGLPKIHEHHGGPPEAYGIFIDGRLAVFYSYNTDIGDGLEDGDVHGDSVAKRMAALQMAINIIVHALGH